MDMHREQHILIVDTELARSSPQLFNQPVNVKQWVSSSHKNAEKKVYRGSFCEPTDDAETPPYPTHWTLVPIEIKTSFSGLQEANEEKTNGDSPPFSNDEFCTSNNQSTNKQAPLSPIATPP